MQEMGAAVLGNKKLIPIVWDQTPEGLPGWMKQYQAVNLAGKAQQEAVDTFTRIAETIKSEKQNGMMILGLIIAGLVMFGR